MKKVSYFFKIIFFTLTSCSIQNFTNYEIIADKITAKTAKTLEIENKLELVGTGGAMMDDIQMMAMSFNYYQEVTLEEARNLIVSAMSLYLSNINSSEKIRPYLHNYPFNAKNIKITIFIYNPDMSYLPNDEIYHIGCIDGTIKYYKRADENNPFYSETYDEALRIVYQ